MINFNQHPFWYCIVFVVYTGGLLAIVRDGIRRRHELSPSSYATRVYGAGFLALIAIAGIALQIWEAYRGR